MTAKTKTMFLILLAMVMLFIGCNEDSSGEPEDEGDDCDPCEAPADCGSEGVAAWKCENSCCVSLDDWCEREENADKPNCQEVASDDDDDSTCAYLDVPNGCCDDSHCITGWECNQEFHSCHCPYSGVNECCDDSHCTEGWSCNQTSHECEVMCEIPADKQCCSDSDCPTADNTAAETLCVANMCVDPAIGCPSSWDCCTDNDCINQMGDDRYVCMEDSESEDNNHVCVLDAITCTPGAMICCDADPGNPACRALGAYWLSTGVLTCNAAGNEYDISQCGPDIDPSYSDLWDCIDVGGGDIMCMRAGRCRSQSDCELAEEQCLDNGLEGDANGLICNLPTVGQGEVCADAQGTMVAYCESDLMCCGTQGEPLTCLPEDQCPQ